MLYFIFFNALKFPPPHHIFFSECIFKTSMAWCLHILPFATSLFLLSPNKTYPQMNSHLGPKPRLDSQPRLILPYNSSTSPPAQAV